MTMGKAPEAGAERADDDKATDRALQACLTAERHVPATEADAPAPAFQARLLTRLKTRQALRHGSPETRAFTAALAPRAVSGGHGAEWRPAGRDPVADVRPEFRIGLFNHLLRKVAPPAAPLAMPAASVAAPALAPLRKRPRIVGFGSHLATGVTSAAAAVAAVFMFAPAFVAAPTAQPLPLPPDMQTVQSTEALPVLPPVTLSTPEIAETLVPDSTFKTLAHRSAPSTAMSTPVGVRPLGRNVMESFRAMTGQPAGSVGVDAALVGGANRFPTGPRAPAAGLAYTLSRDAVLLSRPPAPDAAALAFFPAVDMPSRMEIAELEFQPAPDAAWRFVGDGEVAAEAGARWRTPRGIAPQELRGFGYDDQRVKAVLKPDSELVHTEDGFALVRGELIAEVAADADRPFPLRLDGQTLSIEPGSRVRVSVADPAGFAEGGAPAPSVRVAPGGLAFLKAGTGVTPLFPCHEYRIDRYLNHDLTGFPMWTSSSPNQPDKPERLRPIVKAGYTRAGDRWVAPGYQAGMATTEITRLSREYLELLRRDRGLASVLAEGGRMVVRSGDRYYTIEEPENR